MIKRLDNLGIAVRDARRAIEFYTEKLGLRGEVRENDGTVTVGDVSFYVFETQAHGTSEVGHTVDLDNNPVGIDHIAFEVDGIVQAGAELRASGIVSPGAIVGEPGELQYHGFSDPDGGML